MEEAQAYEVVRKTLKVGEYDESRLLHNNDGDCIAVNHFHLNSLIGSLMHLCDLNSDKEFRETLKSEIKMRCRAWMNDEFVVAGYEAYKAANRVKDTGVTPV